MILRWPSIHAYAAECTEKHAHRPSQSWNWDLSVDGDRALQLAVKGDESIAARAVAAVDKLNATTFCEASAMAYTPDFAGSRVSVPRYLGGAPNAMMRRRAVEKVIPHVNVFVGVVAHAGISANDMLVRGTTILALLESLTARKISVDLSIVVETSGSPDGWLYQVIKVDTRPLDLSVAGFAISHPAFFRNVAFAYARKFHGFEGKFPHGWDAPDADRRYRDRLGMVETDVSVPRIFNDGPDPLLTDPEGWLAWKLETILKGLPQ